MVFKIFQKDWFGGNCIYIENSEGTYMNTFSVFLGF